MEVIGRNLRVLALSPYHGGSHAQFLEEWAGRSRHDFCLLTLPPRHFKWRIRQASVGMAERARSLNAGGARFDIVWTTSMLDAAELRGLLPAQLRNLPLVVYFHENQLAYPTRNDDKRNQHFSLINWASALCGDAVWFNSAFNRDSMIGGLEALLGRMPDEPSLDTLLTIKQRSAIEPPGVVCLDRQKKHRGPLHIAWVARWEHDKRPDRFFSALKALKTRGVAFQLTVLGQSFRTWPPEFDEARQLFSNSLCHIGYEPTREGYERALAPCDVVVSTADHEFFGVALLEAVSAGAVPLVPDKLVYPDIYPEACRYQDDDDLLGKLLELSHQKQQAGTLDAFYDGLSLRDTASRFDFGRRAPLLDDALVQVEEAFTHLEMATDR